MAKSHANTSIWIKLLPDLNISESLPRSIINFDDELVNCNLHGQRHRISVDPWGQD